MRFLKCMCICIRICIYIWILALNDTFYHQHLFKIHYEYNSRVIHSFSVKFNTSIMKSHTYVVINSTVIMVFIFVFLLIFFSSHLLLTDCRDSTSLFLALTRAHDEFHSLQIAMQNLLYRLQRE